jgi:hypothetical protein
VCTLSDNRLIEISGMAALPDGGYVVENDSNDQATAMRVTFLDSKCKPIRVVTYPQASPARDPEDLAVASDGTVWIADTGDNAALTSQGTKRETVALWKLSPGSTTPVIHRLTYPDGPHDAEALLLGTGDTPTIVTKEPSGTAQIYQPAEPLQPNTRQGVPLKNVGSWQPKRTDTPNFLGPQGRVLVTGGAQPQDRKRVALRTYSDAYEWDVPDGDVVKAITKSEPRVTPLPNEPQGEAIAYGLDGKFLTASDQTGPTKILRYQPAAAAAAPAAAATGKQAPKADSRSWYKKLSLPQIINIVGGVGVLGLVLVVVGIIGIRRSRKARRNEGGSTPGGPPPAKGAGAEDGIPAGAVSIDPTAPPLPSRSDPQAQPARGGVYGGGGAQDGGAYGGGNASGGGVYGGAATPGGVYGGGSARGGANPPGGGSPQGGNVYGGGSPGGTGSRGVAGGHVAGGGYAQPGYQPGYHGDDGYGSGRR